MKTRFSELGLLCGNAFRRAEPVLITWLQWERYPLVHEPDWGNLICVPVGSIVTWSHWKNPAGRRVSVVFLERFPDWRRPVARW